MANLPGIIIKIGANTKGAIDGLNRVNAALGKSQTKSDRMNSALRQLGPAFGIAAGAAGAMAITIGVQGVQAAIAEEQELVKLNKTLSNLGFAKASDQVSAFIDNLQFAANVADTDLRNAFSTLLRGTRDVAEAQRALTLAVDVSAGSGRDLAAVAQAMSRGYLGNTTGLMRLNAGISKAILKSGDMVTITKELTKVYGGAASAQSKTLGGAIKGVNIAWDELVESFGQGLIGADGKTVTDIELIEDRLRHLQGTARDTGSILNDAGLTYAGAFDQLAASLTALGQGDAARAWAVFSAPTNSKTAYDLADAIRSVGLQFQYTQYAAYNMTDTQRDLSTVTDDAMAGLDGETDALKRQASAADILRTALDKLNGKNRSVIGDRLALRRMRAEGPGKSGTRKGADGKDVAFTTRDDRIEFALSYAQGAESLAGSLTDKGQLAKARKVLTSSRRYLSGIVGGDMAGNILGTPAYLDRGNAGQRAAGQRYQQGAAQVNNYYFNGDLLVKDVAEAAQQAKKAARLRGLSNRGAQAALAG